MSCGATPKTLPWPSCVSDAANQLESAPNHDSDPVDGVRTHCHKHDQGLIRSQKHSREVPVPAWYLAKSPESKTDWHSPDQGHLHAPSNSCLKQTKSQLAPVPRWDSLRPSAA